MKSIQANYSEEQKNYRHLYPFVFYRKCYVQIHNTHTQIKYNKKRKIIERIEINTHTKKEHIKPNSNP